MQSGIWRTAIAAVWRGALWHQAVACVGLFALCIANQGSLFVGYDGAFYRQKFLHWLNQGVPRAFLSNDIYQGVGDIEFPVNLWFSLPSLATRLFHEMGRTELLYYYFASLLVFLLTASLLRAARFRPLSASILAVVFVGMILKYFGSFALYPIFSISPWAIEIMVVCSTMAALIVRIFDLQASARIRVLSILGFYALALVTAMMSPASIVLCAPIIAVVLAVFCVARLHRLWTASRGVPILLVLLGLLYTAVVGPYVLGIMLNTASSIFPNELTTPRDRLSFISTFFVGLRFLEHNPFDLNCLFYVLAVAGLIYSIKTLKDGPRLLFIAVSICLALLNCLGFYTLINPRFAGVYSIYFEWNVWPLMFVAAMIGLRGTARWVMMRTQAIVEHAPVAEGAALSGTLRAASLGLVCLLTMAAAWQSIAKDSYSFLRASQTSEVVRDLENAIGAPANKPLNGRLLNLTGTAVRDANGLLLWIKVVDNDWRYAVAFGNDFRTYMAWSRDIPTVLQYNQIMSPIYYYVATRAFARPNDQRIRSLLMMSRIDLKWLRIMGVRYVLSDGAIDDAGLHLARSYPVESAPSQPLRLYEVRDWRPFSLLPDTGSEDLVAEIKSERQADVAPRADTEIDVEVRESGITVRKRSGGPTILAVPVIYSHCFSVLDRSGDGGVRLFPAHGATLGIELSAPVTIRLQYRNGPFDNPWCRLKDWQDARKRFGFEADWVPNERLLEAQ